MINDARASIYIPERDRCQPFPRPLPGPGGHWEWVPDGPRDVFEPRFPFKNRFQKQQELQQVRCRIAEIERQLGCGRRFPLFDLQQTAILPLDRGTDLCPGRPGLPDWISPREHNHRCPCNRETMLRMELSFLRSRERQLAKELGEDCGCRLDGAYLAAANG